MDVTGTQAAVGMTMMSGEVVDNTAFLMAMGAGSRIEIHAADAVKETWTDLAQTAEAGDTQLVLRDSPGWEIGDRIAIASTSRDWQEAEEFTILDISADGRTVTLDRALSYSHRGETVFYDNGQTGEDYRAWDVDIRAEVALLSRNVTIQGDADSVLDGFGGHIMAMGTSGLYLDGVELFRMGQENVNGRYPIHWHMLGDAEGQYVVNSSIHESYHKGATIHGTSNVLFEDNVIYDHIGHGLFLEDGSENTNHIYGNLVFSTRENEQGRPIPTDGANVSSYWIENANNYFIGNHAAGSQSNGFWIIPQETPHGLSADTYVGPGSSLADLVFISNTGHTNDGTNGATGTGMTLGIDGVLDSNLNFVTATLDGDFGAVIQDFTSYEGMIWLLTTEVEVADSAFVDTKTFFRHENVIEDTLFAREDLLGAHIQMYRDGGNQLSNVHFDGFYQMNLLPTDHSNGPDILSNVTYAGIGSAQLFNWQSSAAVYQKTVIDLDGAITGTPGTTLVPDTELGAFKAPPGAVYDPAFDSWLTPYTVGATEVTFLDGPGSTFRPDQLRIARSDGAVSDDHPISRDARPSGDLNNGYDDRSQAEYEFNTATGLPQDVVYLIDADLGAPTVANPVDLVLNLVHVRAGHSVVYELPGIAGRAEIEAGGVEVSSLGALLSATQSAVFHDPESGSLFVRLVANDVEVYEDRPVVDLAADYRASAEIRLNVTGQDALSHGTLSLDAGLLDAVAAQPARAPDAAPEAAPETVTDAHYIAYQQRLSSESGGTAAEGRFDVNFDTATGTLSVFGSFEDLDSDVTGIALHWGGQTLGTLDFDSADGRQGSFSGGAMLGAAATAALLAGEVALRVDGASGGTALTGGIEMQPAGDFQIDRPESGSQTVVVDSTMARWSETSTWGGVEPGAGDIVVINAGDTVVLDRSVTVGGIIVNGGALIVADQPGAQIDLSTDYLLVMAGGLFQAGTETDLLDTDFTLTLEGDDPDFDLPFGMILAGMVPGTIFSTAPLASTLGDDLVEGDAFGNRLVGGGGQDTLDGLGGADTILGGTGNDILLGGTGGDELDGGDGQDRASYAGASAAVTVDLLLAGQNTGDAAGDSFVGIEDLEGSDFADELLGNNAANLIWGAGGNDVAIGRGGDDQLFGMDGNDILLGGAGADDLVGGAGRDRAAYWTAKAGVEVDLSFASANTGDAAGDSFDGIEDLQGSDFADRLSGNNAANRFWGGSGNDMIIGRGGDDQLYGMDGNDILLGGVGADALSGGAGRDRAAYWTAQTGVLVDLSFAGSNTGDAAGDTFDGIEDIQGSDHGDELLGNNRANTLWGAGGEDVLIGRGGDDRLFGMEGDDVLVGGAGADQLVGGSGMDRAAYWTSKTGLVVDLANAARNTGEAAGDTFDAIEALQGSGFNDDLSGNGAANWLYGMDGEDRLDGKAGADVLFGGAGADVFIFADAGDADRVADFEQGSDRLDLSAWGAGAVDALAVAATPAGAAFDLAVSFNGYSLVLENVGFTSLNAADVLL